MPQQRHFPGSALTTGLAVTVLAGALYVGRFSIGTVPAMGPLLDPAHGVWALARHATPSPVSKGAIPSLQGPVDVRFDDRGVPHIFAANLMDAARAIGYVHARDRLFQMEIQTRAVAGTLAEMAGTRVVPLDREARALGLAAAAERTFASVPATSESRRLAYAYAEGVNAYLDAMTPDEVPFEFRLLSTRPQRWKPVYTAYLFERMGLTLAYSDGELRRASVEALVGRAATDALFPSNAPIQEPIQPNGQKAPRLDFAKLPPPMPGDTARANVALALRKEVLELAGRADDQLDDVAVGSNNWVVGPKRTAAGKALLAGDPHLSLTLPSIWYQAHIVVKDSLDVYGVTLIGAPIPPIGFTRDVAFSETNTGADVADYYIETVDDSLHPTTYQVDGQWKPLTLRIEPLRTRGGRVIETDTIRETHRGPMLKAGSRWVSRRWTVTDPFDAIGPFLGAARSKSVKEIMTATESFLAPAQNIVMADRGGHIGLRSTGHYPIRPKSAGRGDVLLDGSKSANDWQGWWTPAEYPQGYDPAQGYLASANQQPKDPKVDPRYFGWDWPSPWRAMRINEMLRADSAVTPDKMRKMQTDPVSAQTGYFLPYITAVAVDGAAKDTTLGRAAEVLKGWDGRLVGENTAAVLYEAILGELATRTWDELRAPPSGPADRGGERARATATPQAMILAGLMGDPQSIWWDDRSTTDVRETRDDIIRASVAAAWRRVTERLGPPGPKWEWGRSRFASVQHLLRIPALSRMNVPVQAGPGSVSPSAGDGNHGSSWRMVVELGDSVRAWGIYPGGQSGNPISPRYTDLLGRWSAGTLDTLRFPHSAEALGAALTSSRLVLEKTP